MKESIIYVHGKAVLRRKRNTIDSSFRIAKLSALITVHRRLGRQRRNFRRFLPNGVRIAIGSL